MYKTIVVPLPELNDKLRTNETLRGYVQRVDMRAMTRDTFIEEHASGTLRKSARMGLDVRKLYMNERCAYEFGFQFQCEPANRVTMGIPYAIGDNHSLTESVWHFERMVTMSIFPEDKFEIRYMTVTDGDNKVTEGIGVFVAQTSAQFIRDECVLFAWLTIYDKKRDKFLEPMNPF
jgi:hypothetical protein